MQVPAAIAMINMKDFEQILNCACKCHINQRFINIFLPEFVHTLRMRLELVGPCMRTINTGHTPY